MTEQPPSQPLVSVIVPAYNSARYIGECLESISAQKGDIPFEVIVVDDGSEDDTRDRVRSFEGVRLIRQANAGPSAARNRGVAEARGQYIAFLDSDDLWTEDKLTVQMEIFRTHPEVGMVCGDCRKFSVDGPDEETFFAKTGLTREFWGGPVLVQDAYLKLLRVNYIATGSVIVRKDCLADSGDFDVERRYAEDLDLWFRVAYRFPVAYTPTICQLKRQHAGCVSNNAEAMATAHIHVLEEQRRDHGDLLSTNGISLQSRICLEYCVLGYRREQRGEMTQARNWYWKGLRSYPSVRPVYYLIRTLWPRASAH